MQETVSPAVIVEIPTEGTVVQPGQVVRGAGHAFVHAPITAVEIFLGGQHLRNVMVGLGRSELRQDYPSDGNRCALGFVFALKIPVRSYGAVQLSLRVVTTAGTSNTVSVTLQVLKLQAAPALAGPAPLPAAPVQDALKLMIDEGRVTERGLLRVVGWIVSLTEVRSLEIYVGERMIGLAERGIRRNDVFQSFGDYPDAAYSGFMFLQEIDVEELGAGSVRVVANVLGGKTRQAVAPLEFAPSIARKANRDVTINFHCDQIGLTEGGSLMLEGWAVCGAGLKAVEVRVGGELQGEAALGLGRPDVGNRFPHLPDARRAGFLFNKSGLGAFSGEYMVNVRFTDIEGRKRSVELPVSAIPETPALAASVDMDGPMLRIGIDIPGLSGGAATDPIRGALTVVGWAAATDGIDRVEVTLDEDSLGNAYHGIRREDVQAIFPNIPGSLLSGFAISVPRKLLPAGIHTFRLTAISLGGQRTDLEFMVEAQVADESDGPWNLRRTLPKLEIDHAYHLLEEAGGMPHVVAVIPLRSGSSWEFQRLAVTLKSIRAQAYGVWELRIVVPAEVRWTLPEGLLPGGERYRLVRAARGTRLAELGTADGLFVLLTPGDVLGADALLEAALAASRDRGADFFYSDERRLDHNSNRVQAFFKPDWSPDYLLSTNYIGRLWWARTELLTRIAATLGELSKYGEYDLVLRLTGAAASIVHVARTLCDAAGKKPPLKQERLALQRALQREGSVAEIEDGCLQGVYRVRRAVTERPRISIIIPTIAARGLIRTTIESIRRLTDYSDYEIVCIDNIPESMPDWQEWLRENVDIVVKAPFNFNWSLFNNLGAAQATGSYLLFMNDDMEVLHPDWLDALLEHAQRPTVAIAGPQLLYPDGKVQHAGLFLTETGARHAFRFAAADDPGPFGLALTQRNMAGVTGACMLISRAKYDQLGRFDETHSVVNNDVDFCLKAIASGLTVIYTPFAQLIHHELASRSKIADIFNKEAFYGTWHTMLLKGDPYYSRLLSQDYDDYSAEAEPLERIYVGHPIADRGDFRSILVLKLDHIGDFITALPALRQLRLAFADARIHLMVAKSSVALARTLPFVDEVIEFSFFHSRSELGPRKLRKKELSELRQRLEALEFDIAVDLRLQADTRSVLKLSGAKRLAGFDHQGRFPWLDIALEWEGDTMLRPKREHVSDRLVAMVRALSLATEDNRSAITSTVPPMLARERLRALVGSIYGKVDSTQVAPRPGSPLVCVHPGVGSRTRQWPAEHYASLISLLVEGIGATVILIGSPDEAAIAREVTERCTNVAGYVISLVGSTRVSDLPTVLEACDLYVGNNSGPHHLAAALGIKTIGVHSGVVDAREWGPLGANAIALRRRMSCSPCYIELVSHCHRQMACLQGLRPGDVYNTCLQMLLRPSSVISPSLHYRAGQQKCYGQSSD